MMTSRGELEERSVKFFANSMGSSYGIQARFAGTATLRDWWVHVDVPAGEVRTEQRDPRTWDLMVRAGFAHCKMGGGYVVETEGKPFRVSNLLDLSGTGSLGADVRKLKSAMRLSVVIPPNAPLERSWLVFVFEWPLQNAFVTYALHTDVGFSGVSERPTTEMTRAMGGELVTSSPPLQCR